MKGPRRPLLEALGLDTARAAWTLPPTDWSDNEGPAPPERGDRALGRRAYAFRRRKVRDRPSSVNGSP
ncbi:hypothetical protein EDD90_7921 [Streptomyces sp. Ag109_O5-1]|nr:hypothetical protein EDD90_7921 [Streptomyces sp. Ag109_O5-1]